jgi:hypothetical protein
MEEKQQYSLPARQPINGRSQFKEPFTHCFVDLPVNQVQPSQQYSVESVHPSNGNGILRWRMPVSSCFGDEVRLTHRAALLEAPTTPLPITPPTGQAQVPAPSFMSGMWSTTNASQFKGPLTPIPASWIQSAANAGDAEKLQYPRISVVIPARDEAQNLQHVLPYIPPFVYEVILVDGHSTDGTVEIAQQLMPTIHVIEQMGKGKGDALRIGFAACTGDIIVMLDADGSADPNEISSFLDALLSGNDFAKGSRFIKGGGSQDITFLRRLGNYGLSKLVNVLFRTQFSDLCYGYNAFWKHCLDYIEVDCDGFEVEALINLRMHKANLKVAEVPSFEHARIHGESKLRTFRDGLQVLKTILNERHKKVLTSSQLSLFDYAAIEESMQW